MMIEIVLLPEQSERVKQVYAEMESGYAQVAAQLNFGCEGCPDNCCDSYFQHHTYIEWRYLWQGFSQLSEEKKNEIVARCQDVLVVYAESLSRNERPQVMCPLNEKGRCILYEYRLMVCRTHGVPASMVRPDGKSLEFPGCFRCQDLVQEKYKGGELSIPRMERTAMLQRLARLENELMGGQRHLYPRLQLTIAEMLIKGAPTVEVPYCERKKNGLG